MSPRPAILSVDALLETPFDTIIDTRSPAEFAEDHIPGAINCPVLSDEERAQIGTLYKQVSPFEARKAGAILTARNIAHAIETHFMDKPKNWRPLVYCWRGGQRSGAMQIILREIGWDALKLQGGYKAWRKHVLSGLETKPPRFRYIVISGPTGSGKTRLIDALARAGAQTLDLEGMAAHKGSVLGLLPGTRQTPRKMFDTTLFSALRRMDPARPVFIEDESRRIGDIHLPDALMSAMESAAVIRIEPTVEARIDFLLRDYGYFLTLPGELKNRLQVLKTLQPRERIEDWMQLIESANWPGLVRDLLIHHYDPLYSRALKRRADTRTVKATYTPPDLEDSSIDALARQIRTAHDAPFELQDEALPALKEATTGR